MKDKYWIAFSSIEEINNKTVEKLFKYYNNDVEKAFNCNSADIKNIDGLSPKIAEKFLKLRDKIDPDKCLEEVENRGINYLTLENEEYPMLLKEISDIPIVLYYKGNLKSCNLNKTIAVVGSRKASTNGKQSLKKIIDGFNNTNICIVSGLALGIDTTAHKLAIENNLKTIGVIASGFDYIYPTQNKDLYKQIENGNGAVLTEY